MIVRHCDRCGKAIVLPEETRDPKDRVETVGFGCTGICDRVDLERDVYWIDSIDLCRDCLKDLMNFLGKDVLDLTS